MYSPGVPRLRRRSHRGRLLASLTALVLAVPLLTAAVTPGGDGAAGPQATSAAAPGQGVHADSSRITLVTGDEVVVDVAAGGRLAVTIAPAPRGGQAPVFETVEHDGQVYVIPSDAVPLIPDQLDRELFNITKLAEYGYTAGIPVIVTQPGTAAARVASTTGMSVSTTLPSIDGYAATVAPDGAWWRTAGPAPATFRTAASGLSGVAKVWLDELHEVALAESGPLVGAPQARAAGFDGTGMTIAVLDTGIDGTHPDLVGKVVAAENFTGDPDASDEHGHGTHVAGIAVGTGAASDGAFTGIATGAELISGKVCNSNGQCPTSAMLAGMEWAAPQADVLSLSIGTFGGSDGLDVLSQAVNALTAQHDTLFVIAAGNAGGLGDGSVGSPGAADAALTVGSVNKSEQLAGTSSRGPRLGDFAIKPDITAPGVDIVSARADGTALGPIVAERYTRISGTSMATPHVSGAAAILLQQDPDLSAAELKAALATTAVPNPDLDVYQQGGGRLDIPAALEAPVRATPAPVNLGYFQYPHDDAEPASSEVAYTNRTDQAVTLDLTLDVTSRDGAIPSDAMLSVSPATLTVPAQGTATVTVTVDVSAGEIGLYGGYLAAENAGGDVVVRTPVGFHKEREMHTLTVEGIARDGRPAVGISGFDVVNVIDTRTFLETSLRFTDGVGTVRVPPGTYSVLGVVYTYDEPQVFAQERVMVGDPEVEVTEDTTVVLDAREANPITFDTPQDADPLSGVMLGWWREAEQVGSHSHTHTGLQVPQFATETQPVTLGDFEFLSRHRLVAPQLKLEVVDPVQRELAPNFMTGSPPVDGDDELRLVYAGFGFPEDYEGIDAEGAFVLVDRGPAGFTFAAKEANAAAAGATAIAVANNVGGNFSGSVGGNATIPTMSLSMEEGADLVAMLDAGDVTVRLSGQAVSPFMYDLVVPHPGHVPADLTFVADPEELATLDNSFHSDVADHQMNEVRHFWRPWQFSSFGFTTPLDVPQQRVEHIVPGDTRYRQNLWAESPFTGQLSEPITFYSTGEQRDQTWFRTPMAPGVLDGGEFQASQPTFRDGDELSVRLQEWVDPEGHYGIRHTAVDSSAFRLFEDGELIGEAARGFGNFEVIPGPATHRLELDVARQADWWTTSTETRTAWTLQSPGTASGPVPLLVASYDVDVDLLNTAPHPRDRGGPPTVDLTVRHQPGADGPVIGGARVWVSYDDGTTWRPRPVSDLGDGRFRAMLDNRDPDETNGFVALRVEAWDVDGNRIEQEVIRAWQLAPR